MGDTLRAERTRRPDLDFLYELASEQAGHFTTAQAEQAGVSAALRSYYVSTGTVLRVHPRVYRFKRYPSSHREEVVAAWLAVGKDSAVVSHESALDIWELTDLIPDAIHLTVPRSRRHLPRLAGVRIHTTQRPLLPAEIWTREGLTVTSPERTLLDVASTGQSPEHVIVGVRQAYARGWVNVALLSASAKKRGTRIAEMIDWALSLATSDKRAERAV
jgi:predicted transcriptional regulator of viral defense system